MTVEAQPARHLALYRQYRPRRFDEVRGQEAVTRALKNAVRSDQVTQAYLFSGPRGTGKTSTARILAMALNCVDRGNDGEPCGSCDSCESIRAGKSVDVHELDAASNRKLDEMRDLLSTVGLGTPGRWKVYIIDEVHQLTADASSALLKTLEEPPSHVVFVLATTDPQRVLPTIRSRTQHYELRLIDGGTLDQLVSDVNEASGLGLTKEQLDLVVRRGNGSARDALSALDQAAVAGIVTDDRTPIDAILSAIGAKDTKQVLVAVAEAISYGRDARQVTVDCLDHLRDYFLALQAPHLVHQPASAVSALNSKAATLGLVTIVKAMEVIGATASGMADSADPRVTLEVALIRLVTPKINPDIDTVLERLDRLERGTAHTQAIVPTADYSPLQTPEPNPGPEREPAAEPGPAVGSEHSPARSSRPVSAMASVPTPPEVPRPPTVPPRPSAPRSSSPPAAAKDVRSFLDAFPGAKRIN